MKEKRRRNRKLKFLFIACALWAVVFCWYEVGSRTNLTSLMQRPKVKTTESKETTQKRFDEFMLQVFKAMVTEDTLTLNYTLKEPEKYGVSMEKPTLGAYTLSDFRDGIMTDENWLSSLERFPYEALTEEQKLEYDTLRSLLKTELKSSEVLEYSECLGPTTGIQAQLPLILAEYHFWDRQDIEDYLALLRQIPDYFAQIIDFEKMKSEKKLFMSDVTCQAIIKQCKDFIAEPKENYLLDSFSKGIASVKGVSEEERAEYVRQNEAAVSECVIPAYQSLISALEQLKGTGNNAGGLCKLSKGKQYYEYQMESMTGSYRSISEIDRLVDKALRSAEKKMSRIMTKTPDAYYDAEDFTYPCTDPAETVDYLREQISNDFEPLPDDVTCQVKYVDESLEDSLSPALYMTSPIDDYKQNVVYLNQSDDYDLTECFSTIAHEAYPGHLYQNAYFLSQDPALFRRVVSVGGYSEGWGTYAEKYSYQLAGMSDETAQLNGENLIATLCLYAKADINVNYYDWSRKKLTAFLKDYGFDASQASVVYDSVVAEPVSYMQYTLGYLEINELRTKAENALGEQFSLKEFHKYYLGTGAVPFAVLEDRLDQWIEEQKK
jgi:uncharacterized protein (DUF885 family)